MNPKHCVSLELAKQLKKAGFPQEGEFWWVKAVFEENWFIINNEIRYSADNITDSIVAPLSTEMLERLPGWLEFGKVEDDNFICWHLSIEEGCWSDDTGEIKDYCIMYIEDYSGIRKIFVRDENLCNALAKMYLYLKKEGLI